MGAQTYLCRAIGGRDAGSHNDASPSGKVGGCSPESIFNLPMPTAGTSEQAVNLFTRGFDFRWATHFVCL